MSRADPPGGRIRVASYNMRKAIGLDRRRDPGRTLAVLDEIGADVVALQEADRRFGSRASAIPHHMFHDHGGYRPVDVDSRPHSIGWHGNAILVRGDVDVVDCHALHLPTVEPRGAVVATLDVRGQRLRVVGMHLDISGLRRRKQAHAVLAHLALCDPAPTVLLGDFNEWRDSGACLREFGAHHRAVTLAPSFHSRRPVARLDRMFVSPELAVHQSGVHRSLLSARASDHLPIWAELAIGPDAGDDPA